MSEEAFKELAQLSPVEYDKQRSAIAKELRIRVATLDTEVNKLRATTESSNSNDTDELADGIDPWPDEVNGHQLATDINRSIKTYCVLNDNTITAMTLWLIAAYSINAFRVFPPLGVSSPQKRCGKTTVLETASAVAPRALLASNISAAVMFRAIEKWQPTLIIDEMDSFIDGNEALRGIINSCHTRKGASVLRCEGDHHEPRRYSTWAACIFAKIGEFPDTIADRIIRIELQRKLATDNVSRLPVDLDERLSIIRRKCQRFSDDNNWRLSQATPNTPLVDNDRAEDNWLPLLAVADVIGGQWPANARLAMKSIEAKDNDDSDDIAISLLKDIRYLIDEKNWQQAVHSAKLVEALNGLDERPWPTLRNDKGISAHKLAAMLKPFSIKSGSRRLRGADNTQKGYSVEQLEKVFKRYLPPVTPFQSGTTAQTSNHAGCSDFESGTGDDVVPDSNTLIAGNHAGCAVVPVLRGVIENKGVCNDSSADDYKFAKSGSRGGVL